MSEALSDFPLFPLPVVLLPSEVVPLHIFEERYKTMISLCLDEETEFGIVWLSDDGLKEIGCTARVAEVLERDDEGRMNILVQGGRPFKLVERQEDHAYPAGRIELLKDGGEEQVVVADAQPDLAGEARERYADLLEEMTDQRPEATALSELSSYEMAASVEIDLDVKQGLLELRSEPARLRVLARLFKDGVKRLEVARRIAERAQANGRVKLD